jgi:urease alpha subunit
MLTRAGSYGLHKVVQLFDVVVRGGEMLDGTGAPAWRADIGVTDGRIAALGRLDTAEATDDASVRALLRHRAHVGGSDAIFIGGHPALLTGHLAGVPLSPYGTGKGES